MKTILWLLSLLALPAFAADITPGYTFSSGEQGVTHTKLNNSASGSINTSFYSGKASAGADPNTAFQLLLRDTTLDVFKRSTLAEAVFNHSSLFSGRTAKTTPVLLDYVFLGDSEAGDAYKKMTITNLLFAGASAAALDGQTRFPALLGGLLGSVTFSNLFSTLTLHTLATNSDLVLVLTENGRNVRAMALSSLLTGPQLATNISSTDRFVTWDGTRLRSSPLSNFIDGLTVTNTTPTTNDALFVLQGSEVKKMFLGQLAPLMHVDNIVQSKFLVPTNILGSSGNWSNVTSLGSHALSNSITPHSTSSKILIRLSLKACAAGNSQPAAVRLIRNGSGIGTGGDFVSSGNRTEASAVIPQVGHPETVVAEWLDSPATALAVNYWIEVKATTSTTIYINRTSADTDNENNARVASTLTLQEVFQ